MHWENHAQTNVHPPAEVLVFLCGQSTYLRYIVSASGCNNLNLNRIL